MRDHICSSPGDGLRESGSGLVGAHQLEELCQAITGQGWYAAADFFPQHFTDSLLASYQSVAEKNLLKPAGIGRGSAYQHNDSIRNDRICWLTGASQAERQCLDFLSCFMGILNRKLLLGLVELECHYALYQQGRFYRKHVDGFRDHRSRVVTVILYLNPAWQVEDKGELVLYDSLSTQIVTRVLPAAGTFVCFLSEDFPHEVLPPGRDRVSVSGWFRVRPLS